MIKLHMASQTTPYHPHGVLVPVQALHHNDNTSPYHNHVTLIILYLSLCAWFHYQASTCDVSDSDPSSSCIADMIVCETEQWISQNGSIPGYHVLCITTDSNSHALNIQFYRNGINDATQTGQYISDAKDIPSLRRELERILRIQHTDT
eukprot:488966_1